jgi:hypothetical protein
MVKSPTRSFKKLVRKRVASDPAFAAALLAHPKTYAYFFAKLGQAPNPNARLRRSMRTVPPWE